MEFEALWGIEELSEFLDIPVNTIRGWRKTNYGPRGAGWVSTFAGTRLRFGRGSTPWTRTTRPEGKTWDTFKTGGIGQNLARMAVPCSTPRESR